MTPQAIYDSGWHHPFIAWLGTLALIAVIARRKSGFLKNWLIFFGIEIFLDALCTGAWSPVPPEITSSVGIVFVILGDWRLFALIERYVKPRHWIPRSIALALVVPIAQAIAIKAAPSLFEKQRYIYLVYEVFFVMFAGALRFVVLPARLGNVSPAIRRWIYSILGWSLVQYALWATSDVIILAGGEWALLLRLVPNTMYYAGFLLFVALTAPEDA